MGRKLIFSFAISLGIILALFWISIESNRKSHQKIIIDLKTQKADFMFNEFIPARILEANDLSLETRKKIVEIFDKNYENKRDLEKELEGVLSGEIQNSLIMGELEGVVKGKTLNNITGNSSSNNDLIITIRDPKKGVYVIFMDFSPNCATEDRIRFIKTEREQQFAKKLFDKAFEDFTIKAKNLTFWSYLPVEIDKDWYEEVLNMQSTELNDLRKFYVKYDVQNDALSKFEILVSNRIYDDSDYFNTKSMNYNGSYTKKDMTIVVTSGFNIIDQLNLRKDDSKQMEIYDEKIKFENERYIEFESISVIFSYVIIGIFILLFFYSYEVKNKINK